MASSIKSIHISKLPGRIPTTGWQDEHLSVSPNGRYAIRYYDSFEMTNSAYHWHIALLENGNDVSCDHPALMSIPWSWYHESEDENPYIWNYTGQVVTLARWHDPRLYYNIETKHLFQIECKEAGQLHTACFSPTWDRLLVVSIDHGLLCDSAGHILHTVPLRNPLAIDHPHWRTIYWISSGRDFIVVDRTPVTRIAVTIYAGLDGRVLDSKVIVLKEFRESEAARTRKSMLSRIRSFISRNRVQIPADAGYIPAMGLYERLKKTARKKTGSFLPDWVHRYDAGLNTLFFCGIAIEFGDDEQIAAQQT